MGDVEDKHQPACLSIIKNPNVNGGKWFWRLPSQITIKHEETRVRQVLMSQLHKAYKANLFPLCLLSHPPPPQTFQFIRPFRGGTTAPPKRKPLSLSLSLVASILFVPANTANNTRDMKPNFLIRLNIDKYTNDASTTIFYIWITTERTSKSLSTVSPKRIQHPFIDDKLLIIFWPRFPVSICEWHSKAHKTFLNIIIRLKCPQ